MASRSRSRSRRPPARRGQARKPVPLWQRRREQARRQVDLSPKSAKLVARHLAEVQEKKDSPAGVAAGRAAVRKNLAGRTGAWRFRRHLVPFAWGAGLCAAGWGLGRTGHPLLFGLLASVVVPFLMMASVKGLRPFLRRWAALAAVLTSVWLPVLAAAGFASPVPALLAVCWAVPAGLWVREYRWRPGPVTVTAAVEPTSDQETWVKLAKAQKWTGTLGAAVPLPGGGRRYPIQLDGINTTIRKVLGSGENLAGAWHSPMTSVYAERDQKGIPSRGYLTILPGTSPLQATSWWDGKGMDPATGLARIGRFADGKPAHEKLYTARFGCHHDLDSGTTGSGKSELLNLKIFIALQTGWFVPVILDPQEGQSLPFWRERCIYASGVSEVERRLRGLHAGFLDRSSMLSTYRWDDDGIEMPGMPFFDYELLGGRLPMVWVIVDEAHMVLNDDTKWQRQITSDVVEMARLIRKAGGKMTLATHLPSLSDLGGEQALRDMLRGGNVWSGRTANKVAAGMLGLEKDPSEIARYFGDGSPTAGLGYTSGPDNRPDAPMRNDRVGKDHFRNPPAVRGLDGRFLEVMDKAMKAAVSPTSAVAPLNSPPEAAEDEGPSGRQCADAVWQVLVDRGGPMERGEIIKWVTDLARAWERPKPWTIKAIGNACTKLAEGGVPGRAVVKVSVGVYQAKLPG